MKQKAGFSLVLLPLVLLIFTLFMGWNTHGNFRFIEVSVRSLVKTNLSNQASSLEEWMKSLVDSLEWFRTFPEFQSGDWKEMESVIFQQKDKMGKTVSDLFLVNVLGEMITTHQAKFNVKDSEYFQAIFNERIRYFISGGMISPSDGNKTFLVAVPLYRDRNIHGFLGGIFDLAEVSSWAVASDFRQEGSGSIQDKSGTLIGHKNPARVMERNFSSQPKSEDTRYQMPIPLTDGWNVATIVRSQDILAPLWFWFWVQIAVFLVVYTFFILQAKNLKIKNQVILNGTFICLTFLVLGLWNGELVKHEFIRWTSLNDQIQLSTFEKNEQLRSEGKRFKLQAIANMNKLRVGREQSIQNYIQKINSQGTTSERIIKYSPWEPGRDLNNPRISSEEVVLKDEFGTPKGTLAFELFDNSYPDGPSTNPISQIPQPDPWFIILIFNGGVILLTGAGYIIARRNPKIVHSPEIKSYQPSVVIKSFENMDDFEDY